jgi:hypothetical protein
MEEFNPICLYNTKLSMDALINNIYLFNLVDILKTQELTEEFIVNYILNPKYQLTPEEKSITVIDVLKNQPKINVNKFMRLYIIGAIDDMKPNFEDYV